MKKKILLLCFSGGLLQAQTTPHAVSFFIRPIPHTQTEEQEKAAQEKVAEQMTMPGKMLKSIVKKTLRPTLYYSGIYALYAGAATSSNTQGQILFERSTPEAKFNVLVTEDLKAVP